MSLLVLGGLLAGVVHVFVGPDHLVAVTPLATVNPRRAWLTGGRWGLGHALGMAVMGGLMLALRGLIPLDWLHSLSERLVGAMLLAVGFWGLRTALRGSIHAHEHIHDQVRHVHIHVHRGSRPHHDAAAHEHVHAAFGIGTLHGLAGSSHMVGLLPALALPSNEAAVMYLIAFSFGAVMGMSIFTATVAGVTRGMAGLGTAAYRGFLCVSSGFAMLLGGAWILR